MYDLHTTGFNLIGLIVINGNGAFVSNLSGIHLIILAVRGDLIVMVSSEELT